METNFTEKLAKKDKLNGEREHIGAVEYQEKESHGRGADDRPEGALGNSAISYPLSRPISEMSERDGTPRNFQILGLSSTPSQ